MKLHRVVSLFIMVILLSVLVIPHQSHASSKVLLNVPFIKQNPELQRGCEVTSLAMLLQDAGISVSKMTLAKQVKKVPFKRNGYYGNPYDGFVGDIYTFNKSGYGVYHGPITKLAKQYLPNRIVDLTGQSIHSIYEQLDKGKPVWVITNSWFSKLPSSQFRTWKTKSGNVKITYREHSVVVTGYDASHVYINDPLYTKKNRSINRKNFEASWVQMGRQAITYLTERELAFNQSQDSGKKLQGYTSSLNNAINSGDIYKINSEYDQFTKQIKLEELLIGKVYGPSNRDKLLDAYIKPAKIAKERVIYEVSELRLLNDIKKLIEDGKTQEAQQEFNKLSRLKKRAIEIKKAGYYAELPANIYTQLEKYETDLRGRDGETVPTIR